MPSMKITPSALRHVSDPVSDDLAFRFQNGAAARSLEEFRDAVAGAPAWAVWYHRAHFVPWLAGVLGDEPLARRVEHYAECGGDADIFRETVRDLVSRRVEELTATPPPAPAP